MKKHFRSGYSGSRNLEDWIHEAEFPYIGQAISNIGVQRFSHAFEINASTGQMRPDGGDYFSVITAFLSSGQEFHVCALDATADGYVEIW